MNSMQRVLTALSHREPDRVPLFLLTSLHGAQELDLSIEDYFSKADFVVEGQARLLEKYRGDCLYGFFHAALEFEAWGGEVVYRTDGPPNAGAPIVRRPEDIAKLTAPKPQEAPGLRRALETLRALKALAGDAIPVVGVAISPFSAPIMQMGFDRYFELIYERPDLFERLMAVNEAFCVDWANAQLAAGASAICYFDPMSSTTCIPRELFLQTGQVIARRVLARVQGPCAMHLASGRALPLVADIADVGAAALGVSAQEDLSELKAAAQGKIALLGNLNGIEMRRWTPEQAEREVKRAIAAAGRGGGFVLSDNHGEIPWQTRSEVLLAISAAVRRWGRYPLDWIADETP